MQIASAQTFVQQLRAGTIDLADPTLNYARLLEQYPFLERPLTQPCFCIGQNLFPHSKITLMRILHVFDSHLHGPSSEKWTEEKFLAWVYELESGNPRATAPASGKRPIPPPQPQGESLSV